MSKKYVMHSAHGHYETNNPVSYFFYLLAISPVLLLHGVMLVIGKIWELIFGSDFVDEDEIKDKEQRVAKKPE